MASPEEFCFADFLHEDSIITADPTEKDVRVAVDLLEAIDASEILAIFLINQSHQSHRCNQGRRYHHWNRCQSELKPWELP